MRSSLFVLLTGTEAPSALGTSQAASHPATWRQSRANTSAFDGASMRKRRSSGTTRFHTPISASPGRACGDRLVPGRPGEMEIVEDEAAVVRHTHAAYVAGRSPRDIAGELNREGVPLPRAATDGPPSRSTATRPAATAC